MSGVAYNSHRPSSEGCFYGPKNIVALLLLLSGDVESNPGPYKPGMKMPKLLFVIKFLRSKCLTINWLSAMITISFIKNSLKLWNLICQ